MTKPLITAERLREVLHYDPETGIFRWLTMTSNRIVHIGAIAGTMTDRGYLKIGIDGHRYLAHLLAWLYIHGEWPPRLDHRDTVRNHNWIDNLRISTASQNQFNMRRKKSNTSGFKGVSWDKNRQLWRARIRASQREVYLGHHPSREEAHAAYCRAAQEHHGEFARFE